MRITNVGGSLFLLSKMQKLNNKSICLRVFKKVYKSVAYVLLYNKKSLYNTTDKIHIS